MLECHIAVHYANFVQPKTVNSFRIRSHADGLPVHEYSKRVIYGSQVIFNYMCNGTFPRPYCWAHKIFSIYTTKRCPLICVWTSSTIQSNQIKIHGGKASDPTNRSSVRVFSKYKHQNKIAPAVRQLTDTLNRLALVAPSYRVSFDPRHFSIIVHTAFYIPTHICTVYPT